MFQNGSLRSEPHLVLVFCKSRKIIWDLPTLSASVENSSDARNDDFNHFSIKEEMKTFFRRDVFVIFKLFGSSLMIWIFRWFWRFYVVMGMNVKILCKVLIEVHRVHWLVEGILKYILNKGNLSVFIFTCLKKMFLDFNHFSGRSKRESEGVQA